MALFNWSAKIPPEAHQIAPYTNAMMFIGGLGSLMSYLSKNSPSFWLQIGHVEFSDCNYCRTKLQQLVFLDENSRGKLSFRT